MCGILGFTGKKDYKKLGELLDIIAYRGRDDRIKTCSSGVNLGMNRLAINDLRKGIYPLSYKNKKLIINGEIYNYNELKVLLESKGIKLKTGCDAEVILPLYDLYGMDFLKMLEGMFAICILDEGTKKIILARDRMGEKPLYYSLNSKSGNFCFGSEIKIFTSENKRLNKSVISQYFNEGFISGEQTLISGVLKLESGCFLIYDLVSKKINILDRYWGISSKKRDSKEDLLKNLERLLRESVGKRTMADVPVGTFLSGGIDSSLISFYAARQMNKKLKTYSIVFNEEDCDESKFSRWAAKVINCDHHEIVCDAKKARQIIENIDLYIDEPIADPAVIPTLILAKEASADVKVVLTGEGADEIFGGYGVYLEKNKLKNYVLGLQNIFKKTDENFLHQIIFDKPELLKLLNFKSGHAYPYLKNKSIVKSRLVQKQMVDLEGYLPENLFTKVDRSTMVFGIEARAPFVDRKLVEFGLNLEDKYKINSGRTKYLLKLLAEQIFPKQFVWRPKHGLSVPLDVWFRTELKETVNKMLDDLNKYRKYINVDYCRNLVDRHNIGTENNMYQIWALLIFSKWLSKNEIL